MINKSKIRRVASLSLVVTGFVLGSGHLANSFGQVQGHDPFAQAPWKKKNADHHDTGSRQTGTGCAGQTG